MLCWIIPLSITLPSLAFWSRRTALKATQHLLCHENFIDMEIPYWLATPPPPPRFCWANCCHEKDEECRGACPFHYAAQDQGEGRNHRFQQRQIKSNIIFPISVLHDSCNSHIKHLLVQHARTNAGSFWELAAKSSRRRSRFLLAFARGRCAASGLIF